LFHDRPGPRRSEGRGRRIGMGVAASRVAHPGLRSSHPPGKTRAITTCPGTRPLRTDRPVLCLGQAMTGIYCRRELSVSHLMHVDRYASQYGLRPTIRLRSSSRPIVERCRPIRRATRRDSARPPSPRRSLPAPPATDTDLTARQDQGSHTARLGDPAPRPGLRHADRGRSLLDRGARDPSPPERPNPLPRQPQRSSHPHHPSSDRVLRPPP
jgi:hypothetical protein